MKKKAETYDTLVKHYNRHISPQMTCECGKIILEKQLEQHKTTGVHKVLLFYKKQKEEMTKEQENIITTEEKPLSHWARILQEVN